MSFYPPIALCIVIAFFFLGYYLYMRRRKYLQAQAAQRDNAIVRRPPIVNHQVINMPSSTGRGTVPYYGQEYPAPNTTSNPSSSSVMYGQPPPFKPEEEITLPPPAYNEHKNDVRLPTGV